MSSPGTIAAIAADLGKALSTWGLSDTASLALLSHSENTTFLARDPMSGRSLVLRVHRLGYHSEPEIRSELAWIEALRAEGLVATPAPIAGRDGKVLLALPLADMMRPVVAFAPMSGREPDTAAPLEPWFAALGAITARLHDHGRRWPRPPGFVRKTWDFAAMLGDRPLWGDWRDAPGLDVHGRTLLGRVSETLAARLADYGMGPDRFGLVHADLRLANLLVEGDRLGVIDFDDCGFSWFLYDFAAAISFIEHDPVVPALQAAWLAGYRTIAPVAAVDEAMLPVFVMLRRLLLTAWIASHAETETAAAMGASFAAGTLALGERFLDCAGTR